MDTGEVPRIGTDAVGTTRSEHARTKEPMAKTVASSRMGGCSGTRRDRDMLTSMDALWTIAAAWADAARRSTIEDVRFTIDTLRCTRIRPSSFDNERDFSILRIQRPP